MHLLDLVSRVCVLPLVASGRITSGWLVLLLLSGLCLVLLMLGMCLYRADVPLPVDQSRSLRKGMLRSRLVGCVTQVDLGFLGQVPADLEHSIMLRQRSLSSRTSLEDTGLEQQRLLGT